MSTSSSMLVTRSSSPTRSNSPIRGSAVKDSALRRAQLESLHSAHSSKQMLLIKNQRKQKNIEAWVRFKKSLTIKLRSEENKLEQIKAGVFDHPHHPRHDIAEYVECSGLKTKMPPQHKDSQARYREPACNTSVSGTRQEAVISAPPSFDGIARLKTRVRKIRVKDAGDSGDQLQDSRNLILALTLTKHCHANMSTQQHAHTREGAQRSSPHTSVLC